MFLSVFSSVLAGLRNTHHKKVFSENQRSSQNTHYSCITSEEKSVRLPLVVARFRVFLFVCTPFCEKTQAFSLTKSLQSFVRKQKRAKTIRRVNIRVPNARRNFRVKILA